MVSQSVSERALSDAAFKGMVDKFLAFEVVVQDPARPAGRLIQEKDIASEDRISDAQFEGMVKRFAEFGETVRSQAPLEHPFVSRRPNDMPAHPGTESPELAELDATVEAMADKFQDLEVSGNCFMIPEKTFRGGKGDVQTQFVKVEPRVVDHATSDASDAWKNDTVMKESNETGIEEDRQNIKDRKTARRNTDEGSVAVEVPGLEECEAESVESSLTQPPCLSRDETWMWMRRGNHRLHVELPNTPLIDEGEATVHHFFPDFDYGSHAASQCLA